MGENHPLYKGGHQQKNGYRQICVQGRSVMEHRYVMEQHLGRRLLRSEQVHHKDLNPLNNAIENLELKTPLAHVRTHMKLLFTESEKECSGCHRVLSHSEFYKRKDRPIGINARCKTCLATIDKERAKREKRGTRNRLSDTDVRFIRDCLSEGVYSGVKLANMFNVSRRLISNIKNGKARVNA